MKFIYSLIFCLLFYASHIFADYLLVIPVTKDVNVPVALVAQSEEESLIPLIEEVSVNASYPMVIVNLLKKKFGNSYSRLFDESLLEASIAKGQLPSNSISTKIYLVYMKNSGFESLDPTKFASLPLHALTENDQKYQEFLETSQGGMNLSGILISIVNILRSQEGQHILRNVLNVGSSTILEEEPIIKPFLPKLDEKVGDDPSKKVLEKLLENQTIVDKILSDSEAPQAPVSPKGDNTLINSLQALQTKLMQLLSALKGSKSSKKVAKVTGTGKPGQVAGKKWIDD